MKLFISALVAVAALTATAASAGPMHHHGHRICSMRHHHRVCMWR
ncbi:hypothetical protein [Caulobacter sp. S45]|nr:hypothetical protein [Caulobacter sp. S45]